MTEVERLAGLFRDMHEGDATAENVDAVRLALFAAVEEQRRVRSVPRIRPASIVWVRYAGARGGVGDAVESPLLLRETFREAASDARLLDDPRGRRVLKVVEEGWFPL